MISTEIFELIDNIDMLDSICYLMNYNKRHDNEKVVVDIKLGNLITNNKSSVIEIIYDLHNYIEEEFIKQENRE